MGDTPGTPKEPEKKIYSKSEMTDLLDLQKVELKDKAKDWVIEKAQSLVPALVDNRARELAQDYIEKSPGAQKLVDDIALIERLQKGGAIPGQISVEQALIIKMTCDSLGIGFVDGLKGMCFINGNLFIYGPVFLSQITSRGYKIRFIERSETNVHVELSGPNGKMEGSFTRKQAELAKLWKNVYEKHPITMLTYKAVRDAQKWLCPEVLGSLPLVEEAQEYPASTAQKALDTSGTTTKKLENKDENLKEKYKHLIPKEKTDESI